MHTIFKVFARKRNRCKCPHSWSVPASKKKKKKKGRLYITHDVIVFLPVVERYHVNRRWNADKQGLLSYLLGPSILINLTPPLFPEQLLLLQQFIQNLSPFLTLLNKAWWWEQQNCQKKERLNLALLVGLPIYRTTVFCLSALKQSFRPILISSFEELDWRAKQYHCLGVSITRL